MIHQQSLFTFIRHTTLKPFVLFCWWSSIIKFGLPWDLVSSSVLSCFRTASSVLFACDHVPYWEYQNSQCEKGRNQSYHSSGCSAQVTCCSLFVDYWSFRDLRWIVSPQISTTPIRIATNAVITLDTDIAMCVVTSCLLFDAKYEHCSTCPCYLFSLGYPKLYKGFCIKKLQ
jgi:hypothetical protein